MPQNGEAESRTGLEAVFPGETVTLSTGQAVVIRPWSAGRMRFEILPKIGGLLSALRGGGITPEAIMLKLPVLLTQFGGTITDIVLADAGLAEADLYQMTAADFAKLTRTVLEQNRDFFGELDQIRAFIAAELAAKSTGSTSPAS